jgi:diaminopimelate decarboxylase
VNYFQYRGRILCAEEVPLPRIARTAGTPVYVYSRRTLERHYRVFDQAFASAPHLICYSVKACSNLAILRVLATRGSGFDIVSGGELYRARRAGATPGKVVFSGVGKTDDEIAQALSARILMLNVESEPELMRIHAVARRMRVAAPVALRVNPDVDPRTHPAIATGLRQSKFGIRMDHAAKLYRKYRHDPAFAFIGVDCHIGSQLTQVGPVRAAIGRIANLYRTLAAEGLPLRYLDVGGGLGITYRDEKPPDLVSYARAVVSATRGLGTTLVLEPGRVLVGNAGILLTRVLYRKREHREFIVTDAGMNDLIRPALYGAYHELVPVERRRRPQIRADVVGPVCESTDALARNRLVPAMERGDLIAVMSAGAYGMSMASTYNSRPRPAEVLADGRRFTIVRRRETMTDLVRGERLAR